MKNNCVQKLVSLLELAPLIRIILAIKDLIHLPMRSQRKILGKASELQDRSYKKFLYQLMHMPKLALSLMISTV